MHPLQVAVDNAVSSLNALKIQLDQSKPQPEAEVPVAGGYYRAMIQVIGELMVELGKTRAA